MNKISYFLLFNSQSIKKEPTINKVVFSVEKPEP